MGHAPFEDESFYGLLDKVRHAPLAPPSALLAGLPPALAAAVTRALAREPQARFEDIRSLARALWPLADAVASRRERDFCATATAPPAALGAAVGSYPVSWGIRHGVARLRPGSCRCSSARAPHRRSRQASTKFRPHVLVWAETTRRRTPMANRLHPAHLKTHATWKIRLVDFETGKADLRPEHKAWLAETLAHVSQQDQFWVYIYGFASKLGPAHGGADPGLARAFNRQLSYDRASAVARTMEKLSARVTSRIREFSALGSDGYSAPSNDNSSEERAVEVHVYLVPAPPVPPPNVEPVPPLPGGDRYSRWAIAAPFGISNTVVPGAVVAGNVVVFRCHERNDQTHAYVSPAAGPGFSWAGPKLAKLLEMIKTLLGSVNYSGMSFTETTAVTPFNFRDLDDATCALRFAGGGLGVGVQYAAVSVYGKIWHRTPSGKPFFGTRDFVKDVNCSGKDYQLGIGGAVVGGPLIRVA